MIIILNQLNMSRDLNYCRAILKKVSFDPTLFKKEFTKAYRLLEPEERIELIDWVKGFVNNNSELRLVISSNSDVFTLV